VEPAVGQAVGDGRGQRIHPIGHIQKGECRAAGDAAPDEAGQGVEHLKRILMEKCLLEKIKKKIRFRRPTERCGSSWIMSSSSQTPSSMLMRPVTTQGRYRKRNRRR